MHVPVHVHVTCCMLQSAHVGILYLFYPQVRGKTKGFSFRLLARSCRLVAASVPNPKKHGILNTKAVPSLASFLCRWILSYHIRQRSKKKGFQSHRIWCHFLPPFPPFFLVATISQAKLSFGEGSNQGINPSYLVV